MRDKFLIVIAGPTAVGKTELSLRLAKYYNTVIISADSRQFYRELNIGTAKPTPDQLNEVPHYFINNKSIDELYGAGHYEKDVLQHLDELYKTHDVVFMVGGSGLYIDTVLNGVDDFAQVPQEIRESLNEKYKLNGIDWLQSELKVKDPEYFKAVDTQNPQRIIRALEVIEFTSQKFSLHLQKKNSKRNFNAVRILINLERDKLYQRIEKRVDVMIEKGLLDEVKGFADKKNLNALKTVGYKELYDHLEGKMDLPEAIAKIKQHTRNYAKRQLTWFRNKDKFTEFLPSDFTGIINFLDHAITKK